MITLELRPHTPSWHLPTVAGQWRMWQGVIIAEYTPEQLAWAMACVGHPEGARALARLETERKRGDRLHAESLELRGF
jgi:hypothetical protein